MEAALARPPFRVQASPRAAGKLWAGSSPPSALLRHCPRPRSWPSLDSHSPSSPTEGCEDPTPWSPVWGHSGGSSHLRAPVGWAEAFTEAAPWPDSHTAPSTPSGKRSLSSVSSQQISLTGLPLRACTLGNPNRRSSLAPYLLNSRVLGPMS